MTETEDRIPDDLAWSVIGHGSSTFHMIHGVAGSLQALLVVLPMSWLAAPPYREDRLVFEQDQRVRTTIRNPLFNQCALQLPDFFVGKTVEAHENAGTGDDIHSPWYSQPPISGYEPITDQLSEASNVNHWPRLVLSVEEGQRS